MAGIQNMEQVIDAIQSLAGGTFGEDQRAQMLTLFPTFEQIEDAPYDDISNMVRLCGLDANKIMVALVAIAKMNNFDWMLTRDMPTSFAKMEKEETDYKNTENIDVPPDLRKRLAMIDLEKMNYTMPPAYVLPLDVTSETCLAMPQAMDVREPARVPLGQAIEHANTITFCHERHFNGEDPVTELALDGSDVRCRMVRCALRRCCCIGHGALGVEIGEHFGELISREAWLARQQLKDISLLLPKHFLNDSAADELAARTAQVEICDERIVAECELRAKIFFVYAGDQCTLTRRLCRQLRLRCSGLLRLYVLFSHSRKRSLVRALVPPLVPSQMIL
jgi:hypothetical protein